MGQWLAIAHSPAEFAGSELLAAQAAGKADCFRLSAILGAVMGLYCWTLPHTPPTPGRHANATFEALGEVQRPPLAILFLLAVPMSCVHQFYFVHTDQFLSAKQLAAPAWMKSIFGVGGGGLMTFGQMCEVLVLAAIPLVAKSASRKSLLAVGLVAYAVRMALFAHVDSIPLPPMLVLMAGVGLHGLCFGCFIFVAFMVVDEETTGDVRASAQSLFNLVIVGIGVIVGSPLAGWVNGWATGSGGTDYTLLFSVPMWISLACLALLGLFYPRGASDRGGRRLPWTDGTGTDAIADEGGRSGMEEG
jgi:hypothetical protein